MSADISQITRDEIIGIDSAMECDTTSNMIQQPEDDVSDEDIGVMVDIFKPMILDKVIATELLVFMPDVPTGAKTKIMQLNKHESPNAATAELLQFIESKECGVGKWRTLLDALDNADYPYVTQVLKGQLLECDDMKKQKRIIDIFAKPIAHTLDPMELIFDLVQKRVLNELDKKEIESEYSNHESIAASIILLDRIPRRELKWYTLFLQVLYANSYGHLVELIDPDIYKELQDQESCNIGNNAPKRRKVSKDNEINENTKAVHTPRHGSFNNKATAIKYPIFLDIEELAENTFEDIDKTVMHPVPHLHILADDPDETLEKERLNSASMIPKQCSSNTVSDNLTNTLDQLNMGRQTSTSSMTDEEKELLQRNMSYTDSQQKFENPNSNMLSENILQTDGQLSKGNSDLDELDSDERLGPKEPLVLRGYQKELAEQALEGNNVIIVAPTGSGKTHVAMEIIQNHMKKMQNRRIGKVIFLVEQNALAKQQRDQIRDHLDYRVKGITGETQRVEQLESLSVWLGKRDILVVTAQLLVNALVSGDVKITDFTLMIFDECHHTTSKHPYNQIMHRYMDSRYDESTDKTALPQIVGLTASVGVGKAKNLKTAISWIKKVMANLNVIHLTTVRNNKAELSNFSSIPEEEVEQVRRREKDFFGEAIRRIMDNIEVYMKVSQHVKDIQGGEKTITAPAEKGVDQYTQWLSCFQRESAKIHDQNARRFFVTCKYYLEAYHKTLMVYADARVKDALDFLEEQFRKWDLNSKSDGTDKKMKSFYETSKQLMEACITDPQHDNPKLVALKKMIIKAHKNKEDMRGIIFVKTRDLVTAIESWMKETPGLSELNPVKFVGAQASSDKGGMTKSSQDNVLKYFREGKHKLIIATSVAEEGLDIRKCNLVIRYDHVTNEIAMVQSRGRGRAEDSKYVVLAEEGGRTAAKEELNILREAMMNKAIIELQEECRRDPQQFLADQENLQKESKIERELEAKKHDGRVMVEGEFTLMCNRCSSYICMSSDLRKIQGVHHAVVHPEIIKHVKITKKEASYSTKDITCGIGKINCLECLAELGNVALYKSVQFSLMKISNFVVEDNFYNKNVYKNWKKVPFHVQDLSNEDLQRLADAENLVEDQ